jgi:hypothetical protein
MNIRPLIHMRPNPDDFRAYLAAVASTAIVHANCARDMAEIRDDDALAYHLHGMIQSARLARDVLKDFRKLHYLELDEGDEA